MPVDINARVLAAFQAEHKEQLEGIRAILAELECDQGGNAPECIHEAFRLAHSLKGGARVCDLRPAEALAHGLENVFEEVRSGHLRLEFGVVKTINLVLDTIEDWMAALERDEHPPEADEAMLAVKHLLEGDLRGSKIAAVTDEEVAQRLVATFCSECPQYLAGLRKFVAALDDDRDLTTDELDEAFRLAHNLRDSAHAAEIETIVKEGDALEGLIAGIRERTVVMDAAGRKRLTRHVDTIDQELLGLKQRVDGATSHARHPEVTRVTEEPVAFGNQPTEGREEIAKPPSGVRNRDTVRISTESLDRLLRSSRQLVADSIHRQQTNKSLQDVHQLVDQMQRERESIRRIAAGSLHRLVSMPEFHRLATYFETVDRSVQSLARHTRSLCTLERRSAWKLQARVRQVQQDVQQARMVPAEVVFQGLRKLVRDLSKEAGKQVEFHVSGFDVRADRMVFQALKDPLIHMLRNSIVHGIESPDERSASGKSLTCHIDLRIEAIGNRLTIEVDDDGRGIDRDLVSKRAIERGLVSQAELAESFDDLVFQPGLSTSTDVNEISGRGMGLSVVKDAVMRMQGDVHVSPKETAGTKFRISIPLCVSTHRLLLVSANGQTYAIPLHGIDRLMRIRASEMETIEGQPVMIFQGRPIPLLGLASALGGMHTGPQVSSELLHMVVLKSGMRRVAVRVDAFLAEKDELIHELDRPAASERYLGALLMDDGHVALVLNPSELMGLTRPTADSAVVETVPAQVERRKSRVLVVDDSFTTRTLEKSILEANGYHVGIAVDGVEGLNQLKSEHYDLVISDVEMPRMDGFTLLAEIKNDRRLSSTPVILVTSRADHQDQAKGLDLGAEAYIVKRKFDHQSLLSTIRQIIDV